jgi:hypothetical protein
VRARSLFVLLAVVVALGAFIWFYERDLPGSEEREAQARRLIPGLEVEEVTAFEVEVGGERVRIERVGLPSAAEEDDAEEAAAGEPAEEPAGVGETPAGGGEWRIAAPERYAGARADRVAVDGLLSSLASLERGGALEGFDRRALGFDEPRARVTIERREGGPIALAVGADVPASSDMVVLREDSGEAHRVDRTILQDLTRDAGDWRSREMFAATRAEVSRLTLAGAGVAGGGAGEGDDAPEEIVLERAARGFRLVRPVADLADPDAVEALFGALTGLAAERFVDLDTPDPAALGLAPPRGRIVAELSGGRPPVEIEVGAPRPEGDGHTFRVGRQVFVAESALAEALARPPAAWQSPALTDLELYRVDAVTVEGPEGRLELARSGTDWRRGGETISYTPVSDLLFSLVEARAEEIVPRAAARPGAPRLTVELAAGAAGEGRAAGEDGAAERQTIVFHAAAAGLVPVTVSGRRVVLLVAEPAVEAIRANLAAVRAAPVVAAAAGEEVPEGIEIEREEGP